VIVLYKLGDPELVFAQTPDISAPPGFLFRGGQRLLLESLPGSLPIFH
jgi:hypothetical protein